MTQPRRFRATAALVALPLLAGIAAFTSAAAQPASPQAAPTPPAGCTGQPSATWLNVSAEGLRSSNGLLAVTLYIDDSSKFLVRHGSIAVGRVQARTGTTRACIFLPKPGVYALALYHDENGDQSFNRSGIGLPTEGYGFTNNPVTLAGLPNFKSVRLNVTKAGLTTRIQMKYP
jgi:uncharacterized protein (DUF2141 family)